MSQAATRDAALPPNRWSGMLRRLAWLFVLASGAVRIAAAEAVFRPLIADPRESMSRWRIASYTEDWRYGTDITDSTSQGGVERNRTGLQWEVAAGNRFRWHPLRKLLGMAPWREYQLGAPLAIIAVFDNSGSLLNTDFQFGGSFETQWSGPPPRASSSDGAEAGGFFDRPVVTSRVDVFHRSSHLGDEYVTLSRFGRNQNGSLLAGALFDHPPVKRVDLSYEAVEAALSAEWSPRWNRRRSVARAYASGGAPLAFPAARHIGTLRPRSFRAPWFTAGAELRGAGNDSDPHDGVLTRLVNGVARTHGVESSWFGAFDLRLAKPYNFASGDNPTGEIERWTPHLWTDTPYGREFRHYAGSWHAMVGAVLWPARSTLRTPLAGPEWLVSLEWYRGYSRDGQFLDQRLRWYPRWYVVPSVTARF